MNKNILYITDEYLYLYSYRDEKIYKISLNKNIVINGKVANINKFIHKYENFIKKNNLNKGLIGDKIKIIVNPKYTIADIILLKNIFEKMNYRKVYIENETKYYKLNNNSAWINVSNNYMILTYINEYNKNVHILIESNFFNSYYDLFKFIKTKVGNKEIYLFGNGKSINNFYNNFEKKYGNKTYMFADSELFLFNAITNL